MSLACLYLLDAADAAAIEDGFSDIHAPDGYWIRNHNPATYTLGVVPDVAVGLVPAAFSNGNNLVPAGNGLAAAVPVQGRPVWVRVVDGWVVAIQQQYFP